MTRRATPTDPHVTRIEDGSPDRLRRRAEDYIARARDAGAVVLTIKPAYESRRIVAYDVAYIAPERITEGADDTMPHVLAVNGVVLAAEYDTGKDANADAWLYRGGGNTADALTVEHAPCLHCGEPMPNLDDIDDSDRYILSPEWHAPECSMAPAPAVVATPLGLAYLLPGFEPAPVVVAPGVTQSTML